MAGVPPSAGAVYGGRCGRRRFGCGGPADGWSAADRVPVRAWSRRRHPGPRWAEMSSRAGIDLYWLPLGAGGHSVRWNGRVYEAVSALVERRAASALYHSAVVVSLPPDTWVIEMTPVWAVSGGGRGGGAERAGAGRWAG